MNLPRIAVLVALLAVPLSGCGLGLPPAGDYATVFGQVTNTAGQPVAGATVLVNDVLSATTDAAGNFTLTPVPTGAWSYTVMAPNYKNVGSTSPPPLTPGEKRNFPIRLMPAAKPAPPTGGTSLERDKTVARSRKAAQRGRRHWAHVARKSARSVHANAKLQETVARRVSSVSR